MSDDLTADAFEVSVEFLIAQIKDLCPPETANLILDNFIEFLRTELAKARATAVEIKIGVEEVNR